MKTTSTYGAELLSVMGDDLTVVNAARVSFDKESEWETVSKTELEDHVLFGALPYTVEHKQLKDADARLIAYLARNGHWTPFAHPQLSFRVSAPIPIARQMFKHKVGMTENEISRRYVDSEPTIYVPEVIRKRPTDGAKQGSSDEACGCITLQEYEQNWGWNDLVIPAVDGYVQAAEKAVEVYEALIAAGACPEQSRFILPQAMMTEWVWTGSLAAFARVCNQRLDAHAQRECSPIARSIASALDKKFPTSWAALRNYTS